MRTNTVKRIFKKCVIPALALIIALASLTAGCGLFRDGRENIPYEPDTPAPAPHEGVFISEHGSMRFFGDGKRIEIDFDSELARLTGLPEGKCEGTYDFLSGNLPPHGSMPVRYDTAHEMKIEAGGASAVIKLGIAAADGKTSSSGVGTVTPERIPMVFSEDGVFTVMFEKDTAAE